MIETSNSQDSVESTSVEAASPTEQTETNPVETNESSGKTLPSQTPQKELSLKEKILAQRKEDKTEAKAEKKSAQAEVVPAAEPAAANEAPAYQANLKYKAFGKEKELDPFWAPLIKDAESEKKVKDVFTRADAFDDMKGRYESASTEHQKVLTQFTALDRDVKRVTKFLNAGDYDNFFQSLRISDDMLLQHLQNKAEIARMSPVQQQAYQQGVEARANQFIQQEQYESLQNNYANQAAAHRTMQLDLVLGRPDVNSIATAWDSKMGRIGSFRDLVIQEAQSVFQSSKQDLSAEAAVDYALKKFGKLVEPSPQSQVVVPTQSSQNTPQTPQAPVSVQGKPVIPNVQGRGTSPVKQAPKSLAELRKIGKAMNESDGVINL